MSTSQRYPGPWREDADAEIPRTLAWNHIQGCGELYFRPSLDNETHMRLSKRGEYLVACSDGEHRALYVVFTVPEETGTIVGPAEKPVDIDWPKFTQP
jgi:hypothetical protein